MIALTKTDENFDMLKIAVDIAVKKNKYNDNKHVIIADNKMMTSNGVIMAEIPTSLSEGVYIVITNTKSNIILDKTDDELDHCGLYNSMKRLIEDYSTNLTAPVMLSKYPAFALDDINQALSKVMAHDAEYRQVMDYNIIHPIISLEQEKTLRINKQHLQHYCCIEVPEEKARFTVMPLLHHMHEDND